MRGVWRRLFDALARADPGDGQAIDSKTAKAHRSAAGGKGGRRRRRFGRSRGGRTTKIHAIVDSRGRPIAIEVTPGHLGDVRVATALISGVLGSSLSRRQDAIDAGKILVGRDVGEAAFSRDRAHIYRLARAEFRNEPTARSQQAPRFRQDSPIGVETVKAAVERERGIEVADLARQSCEIGRGNVGRVRHDQVKLPEEAAAPVANSYLGPQRQPARLKIGPRNFRRIG
jgi:transposase